MMTILNQTSRFLRITLSRGKVLRLGPRKEGQISTQDVERDCVGDSRPPHKVVYERATGRHVQSPCDADHRHRGIGALHVGAGDNNRINIGRSLAGLFERLFGFLFRLLFVRGPTLDELGGPRLHTLEGAVPCTAAA